MRTLSRGKKGTNYERVMYMAEIDAKSYLRQIKLYDTRINMKIDELAALKASLTKITPTLRDDAVSSSGSQDKLGDAVAKMVDLRNEINADIDRFVDAKRSVGATIDSVSDPDQMQVLHKRYVLYESFEQIAIEMGFTYRHITRIHGEALQSVKKILKNESCPKMSLNVL